MKRSLAAAILAVGLLPNAMFSQTEQIKPPVAKKEPKVLKIHGYEIVDNYAWLRDRNDDKNPEIVKYLEAENAYTESFMSCIAFAACLSSGVISASADSNGSSNSGRWLTDLTVSGSSMNAIKVTDSEPIRRLILNINSPERSSR